MTPMSGPVGGGTRVTITGRSLVNPQRVVLGGDELIEGTIVDG